MSIPKTIAIDGPAASGKTTLGFHLAESLNFLFFDTGVMYRAVTWAVMDREIPVEDETAVTQLAEAIQIDVLSPSSQDGRTSDVLVDGKNVTWEIRQPVVEANVSKISAYPGVRRAMTQQQRRIGQRGEVVMVGRDIGTVVLPDAETKIYLDASVEERARRRHQELSERGDPTSFETILASMRQRDEIDSNRIVAPLRAAADAIIVHTDGMDMDQVLEKVKALLKNWRV
jgi:CMP/dCMP kinase